LLCLLSSTFVHGNLRFHDGKIDGKAMPNVYRLTALRVQREKRPGMHADGRGLYLCIGQSGARSWVLRYMLSGKRHDMGLGSALDVSLGEAREKAASARKLKAAGVDPLVTKRASRAAARVAEANAMTFGQCAEAYLAKRRAGWRSVQYAKNWHKSLVTYVLPALGSLPAATVDTALVVRVLEPIWNDKPVTAAAIRGRIESVLDFAKVGGFRDGENPARWGGHLDQIFSAPAKVKAKEHHAALPYADMPVFMRELRKCEGVAARALEFTILTAARTGEVRGATAAEFDKLAAVWTVPGARMKGGREHRVPLSAPALALVGNACSAIAKNAMADVLANLRPGMTVHGFRSTFRDWAAETSGYPNHVVEMALAHAIPNAVEAAYRRGDLFEKRRALMDEWAASCFKEV
jgi:integrase